MGRERHLDWPGMGNVRDLGGLPTSTGGTIRWGALVRSEGLDRLAPEGWAELHRHGVRTCIDLRSGFETEKRPYGPGVDGVDIVSAALEEGLLDDPEFRSWAETGLLGTALYYAPYLERWPERTAHAVKAVADARPGGVLYHCARGRDRTGLLTLLLLSLAGVPDDVIVADHLLTEGATQLYASRGTTAEATLHALLEGLDVVHLLRGAGLSGTDLVAVRDRLVEQS